jgi:hypothetical protein
MTYFSDLRNEERADRLLAFARDWQNGCVATAGGAALFLDEGPAIWDDIGNDCDWFSLCASMALTEVEFVMGFETEQAP